MSVLAHTSIIVVFERCQCHSGSGRRNLAAREAVDSLLKHTSKILFKFYLCSDSLAYSSINTGVQKHSQARSKRCF